MKPFAYERPEAVASAVALLVRPEVKPLAGGTNLPEGALITAVELPALPLAAASTYRKARDRASYAFALGSVAARLTCRAESCETSGWLSGR